jgi:hypothetical protein
MKFSRGRKFEFKKSLELHIQILVRVSTNFAVNFAHFAWHGFNAANIKQNFQVCSTKFSKNLLVFYRIKQKVLILLLSWVGLVILDWNEPNTQAYHDTELITTVKKVRGQARGVFSLSTIVTFILG